MLTMVCEHCGEEFETTPFSPCFMNRCCHDCLEIYGRDGGGDEED